jgi:hypothetical protein
MKRWTWTAAVVVLLSSGGCASLNLDTLADVIGGPGGVRGNQVRGEIERIDQRRREMDIRSETNSETRVHFDTNTEFLYRNRDYPVTSLQGGDRVMVRVERRNQGQLYAQQVVVEELSDTPNGPGQGRVEQFEGRVGSVDSDRGRFTLQASRTTYTVTLAYNASRATVDRLNRLRTGESVRIEGELLNNGRVELHRFR